jgi:hypothetical protein
MRKKRREKRHKRRHLHRIFSSTSRLTMSNLYGVPRLMPVYRVLMSLTHQQHEELHRSQRFVWNYHGTPS